VRGDLIEVYNILNGKDRIDIRYKVATKSPCESGSGSAVPIELMTIHPRGHAPRTTNSNSKQRVKNFTMTGNQNPNPIIKVKHLGTLKIRRRAVVLSMSTFYR